MLPGVGAKPTDREGKRTEKNYEEVAGGGPPRINSDIQVIRESVFKNYYLEE